MKQAGKVDLLTDGIALKKAEENLSLSYRRVLQLFQGITLRTEKKLSAELVEGSISIN